MVASPPDVPTRLPPEVLDEVREAVQARAKDAEQRLAEWLDAHGLKGWSALVANGPVVGTLVREAEERDADVVLLGSRGLNHLESALLGSVTRAVLHRAHTDVLVARPRAANGPLRRIVVATDLQAPSVAAARRAFDLAERDRAELVLLHVIDPGEWAGALYPTPAEGRFNAEWLRKHVLDGLAEMNRVHLGGRADEVVVHGHAAGSIVAKAKELHADLVVVGTHGGGALSRALLGSTADAVAERAGRSVLVVRRPPETRESASP